MLARLSSLRTRGSAPAPGSGAGNGVSTSVSSGTLTVDSGLGGTARLYVRWSKPTTNADASALHDLKTFKLYVGTSASGSQVVNGLDFSTTGQKIPTECKITGLANGTTYYVRVTAVDTEGNESAASSEFSGAAAVYSAPSRSYTDISSTTTISVSGDYRLSADFTGTVTINASNVYLYGNGHTITHSAGAGVAITGASRSNVWVDGIVFNRTSGTQPNISIGAALGSGCQFSNNTFTVIAGSKGIYGGGFDLGGARIYGNTCTISSISALDDSQAMLDYAFNFLAYNNTCVNSSTGNRSGMYGNCEDFEAWAETWSCTGATLQAFFFSIDNRSAHTFFIHDCNLTVGANADTMRVINADARTGPIAGEYLPKILWNTFTFTQSGSSGPGIRVRGAVGPIDIGYNTFNMGGGGSCTAISFGDDQDGASGALPQPYGGYIYGNVSSNYGSTVDLGFYGGDAWDNTLTSWRNTFGKQGASGGDGTSGNWDSNSDTIVGTVSKVGSSTWREYNISLGGSNPFSVQGSWIGYNPASDTPSAPGIPTAVTGVA